MDAQQVLVECYLAMSNVEYDLARWEEELEQFRFATLLDEMFDFELGKLDQAMGWNKTSIVRGVDGVAVHVDPDREYPVAWYEDGTRVEIGTAKIDPKTGVVSARIDREFSGLSGYSDMYSIGEPFPPSRNFPEWSFPMVPDKFSPETAQYPIGIWEAHDDPEYKYEILPALPKFNRKWEIMAKQEPVRTNPETCRHDVLQPTISGIICASCEIPISEEWMERRAYDFDIDNNVWVRNYIN